MGDELVARVLRAATHAPSAENRQPWAFVVVREPARRGALGELMKRAWEDGGREYASRHLPARFLAEVDRGARGGVAGAPVMVVVCADAERCHPSALPASVFPAVQNLLLAASALGLGSVLTTLALQHAEDVAALLQLPPHVRPMAVVPLGWPARVPGPPARRELGEIAHREIYGAAW